nr:alpha-amylase family glycosyl hydrolase [Treponema denticola]
MPWTPLFENHDQARSVSRFGDEEILQSVKMLATVLLTQRNTFYLSRRGNRAYQYRF